MARRGGEAGARRRRFSRLSGEVRAGGKLRDLGMDEGCVETFVDDALASGARGLTASPIDLERRDLVGIYEAALAE